MTLHPHAFWQEIAAPQTHDTAPSDGFLESFPAPFADGRQLLLPLRVLPGDGTRAVASLIINQASFAVEDALAQALADLLRPYRPEVMVGVPTLGLSLANNVARRLGHDRMVALSTSQKFWYREELSEPVTSITSPEKSKTLFIDPRMLPLLSGKRVAVIDDVVSSGSSMLSVLKLLQKASIEPVVIGAAMIQGSKWQESLKEKDLPIVAPIASPIFQRTNHNRWMPEQDATS